MGKRLRRHERYVVIVCRCTVGDMGCVVVYVELQFCQILSCDCMSLLATASMWWRSVTGQEQIAATVCRHSRSSGNGSINDSKFELAIPRSGTDGLDSMCCGSDAPSHPASKYWRGRFAGVIRLVITTGETASRVVGSVDVVPAGKVASEKSEFPTLTSRQCL